MSVVLEFKRAAVPMKTVIISTDPFNAEAMIEHRTDDVCALIREKFPKWPDTARIYHGYVATNCDVTPRDEAGVDRLQKLEGKIIVALMPAEPISIGALVTSLLLSAASATLNFLLSLPNGGSSTPQNPVATQRNIAAASPNNELAQRSNSARLHGRIPDIFGTVRSTPDLIAVPYSIFDDHEEVEIAYMCIGRGEYEVSEPRDGDTPIAAIEKASVEVYAPFTSPNSGDSPQFSVGAAIGTQVANISRLTAVNGQDMLAPNANGINGNNNIRFTHANTIETNDANVILSDYFQVGDSINVNSAVYSNSGIRDAGIGTATFSKTGVNISGWSGIVDLRSIFVAGGGITISSSTVTDGVSSYDLDGSYTVSAVGIASVTLVSPASVNTNWNLLAALGSITSSGGRLVAPLVSVNLAGVYTITAISAGSITLLSPASVNTDWNILAGLGSGATEFISPLIFPATSNWIGPFVLPDPAMTSIILNYVALNGLYRDDGTNQTRLDLAIDVETTPLDASGSPTASPTVVTTTIEGSSAFRTTRALTATIGPLTPSPGGYRIKSRRNSSHDYGFSGTTVDGLKWRDCYSSSPFAATDFGNVTTVQSVTHATSGALAVKQRKLSLLVTRKVPAPVVDGGGNVTGFTAVAASNDAADILCAVALDPYIGRRTQAELDLNNIYETLDDIEAYFGDARFREFSYTFDKSGLSFEETVALIAQAVCCTAYRRGSQMKLSFEQKTENSGLLFNHRNKIPKSEIRTVRFGLPKDNDGIEFSYVDPDDDAIVNLYIPADRSATQPRKIESVGIRSVKQAYVAAWRAYNKMLYQNTTTQFEALQESDLLVVQDRILVADNTRSGTIDGEVISQDVLTLELSQVAVLDPLVDYTIFLQHTDGTVESMAVTQGDDTKHVVLDNAPANPLSLDVNNSVRAGYVIVRDDAPRKAAFLVTEKRPKDNFTNTVTAINYDARYYQNDLTYPA